MIVNCPQVGSDLPKLQSWGNFPFLFPFQWRDSTVLIFVLLCTTNPTLKRKTGQMSGWMRAWIQIQTSPSILVELSRDTKKSSVNEKLWTSFTVPSSIRVL